MVKGRYRQKFAKNMRPIKNPKKPIITLNKNKFLPSKSSGYFFYYKIIFLILYKTVKNFIFCQWVTI